MFNILNKNLEPTELLLLKSLEPRGVNMAIQPDKIFSEDYISYVWSAFNAGKVYLEKGGLQKAIASAKHKLNSLLAI